MTLIYYFKIEYIMGFNNIKFISNNVRAIKNSDKRIKIFEYLKKKVNSNGVLFLQETHSCEKDEKKWNDGNTILFAWNSKLLRICYRILKSKFFYSRGKKNGQNWSPFTS